MFLTPSVYTHIFNILLIYAFILLYKNYKKIKQLEPYKLIIIILLFSLTIGIHSLSHICSEKGYDNRTAEPVTQGSKVMWGFEEVLETLPEDVLEDGSELISMVI